MILRTDNNLALEVNYRKYKPNNPLSLWTNVGHLDWSGRFCLNNDMTISPVNKKPLKHLRIGAKNDGTLILVKKGDAKQIKFKF